MLMQKKDSLTEQLIQKIQTNGQKNKEELIKFLVMHIGPKFEKISPTQELRKDFINFRQLFNAVKHNNNQVSLIGSNIQFLISNPSHQNGVIYLDESIFDINTLIFVFKINKIVTLRQYNKDGFILSVCPFKSRFECNYGTDLQAAAAEIKKIGISLISDTLNALLYRKCYLEMSLKSVFKIANYVEKHYLKPTVLTRPRTLAILNDEKLDISKIPQEIKSLLSTNNSLHETSLLLYLKAKIEGNRYDYCKKNVTMKLCHEDVPFIVDANETCNSLKHNFKKLLTIRNKSFAASNLPETIDNDAFLSVFLDNEQPVKLPKFIINLILDYAGIKKVLVEIPFFKRFMLSIYHPKQAAPTPDEKPYIAKPKPIRVPLENVTNTHHNFQRRHMQYPHNPQFRGQENAGYSQGYPHNPQFRGQENAGYSQGYPHYPPQFRGQENFGYGQAHSHYPPQFRGQENAGYSQGYPHNPQFRGQENFGYGQGSHLRQQRFSSPRYHRGQPPR